MKKRVLAFSVGLLLVLGLLAPVVATAQAGPSVTDSSVTAEFPLFLHFNMSAESASTITDIRLQYKVEHDSFADVTSEVYIDFTPSSSVDAAWTWDMRQTGGLPPGTKVDYWWIVRDSAGHSTTTSPASLNFDDNRYKWQSLTRGMLTINWYSGDQSFAEDLMTAAQDAVTRLTAQTGAYLKKAVGLYIYANTNDLRGAMIFPQEWTGGVSYSGFDIIAIGIEPGNLVWGTRAIAHELTHLVVHQMTHNPYSGLPTWLEEGLAVYNEGPFQSAFLDRLKKAVDEDNLITVRSLSSPFSAFPDASLLSYAESYSVVEYLVTTYGQDKMLKLLMTFSEGNTYDGALEKVYEFDMDGLNSAWKKYVFERYQKAGISTASYSPTR